jgi:DNA-binding NtrC family response regulator
MVRGSPQAMQATLIVREGARHFSYDLRKLETVLGRDPKCDLIVSDALSSRKHALITKKEDGYHVEDLGSRNGTFVNEKKLAGKRRLEWGDCIRIGPMQVLFVYREEPAPKAESSAVPAGPQSAMFRRKTVGVNVGGFDLSYVKKPRPAHMNLLVDVATRLVPLRDPEHSTAAFLDSLLRHFEASRAALLEYGEGPSEIRSQTVRAAGETAPTEIEFEKELLKLVRATQRAFLQDEDYSALYLPFSRNGEITGVLYLDNFQQARRLTEDDLWVAHAAGEQFAAVIAEQEYRARLEREKLALEEQAAASDRFVAAGESMRKILAQAQAAAPGDAVAILRGEQGTGKDLLARTIHLGSRRRGRAYFALNCAAFDARELERQLFGYEAGAFEGADAARKGAFEHADGGTLFLDEVGEMPLELQNRVVDAIREGKVARLGGSAPIAVDVRVIVAANDDLKGMVSDKRIREALKETRDIVEIRIPPLRERLEELRPLAEHFVGVYAAQIGKRVRGISPQAADFLGAQNWTGNVRELKNLVERAVMTAAGPQVSLEDLQCGSAGGAAAPPTSKLADMERMHIRRVLQQTNGNREEAARILDLDPDDLEQRLQAHGLV